jgi:predicted nucleic acid-binding protein
VPVAELDAALADAELVLADSSVVIAFWTAADRTHQLARHLFGRIERHDDRLLGLVSAITASEIMVHPLRAGPEPAATMQLFLTAFPNLGIAPVDLAVALRAAAVRAQTGLKTPDALIVATALEHRVDAVATNDEAWATRLRSAFPSIRWICLGALA